MRKQCAETYKKQCRMITYCLHQMLILQHASLFQICNAVTISSETKPLPFHTVAPNLHEKKVSIKKSFSPKIHVFTSETRIILSFSSSIHLFCWNRYVRYTSQGYSLSHSLHGKGLLHDLSLITKK